MAHKEKYFDFDTAGEASDHLRKICDRGASTDTFSQGVEVITVRNKETGEERERYRAKWITYS